MRTASRVLVLALLLGGMFALCLCAGGCQRLPTEPGYQPPASRTPAPLSVVLTCSDGSSRNINDNSDTTCPAGATPVSIKCYDGATPVACPWDAK